MTTDPELCIFATFYATVNYGDAVAAAIREVIVETRKERGCLFVDAYRSAEDSKLFYIHSRWLDDRAFETHALLSHTKRFLELVRPLLSNAAQIHRTRRL